MSDSDKIKYLPFQAVNEFMRDDYRLVILQEVFNSFEKCTPIQKQLITRLFTRGIQIPGFRNSSLAPLPLRIKNSTALFEQSSEFAATIIECWSNLHMELKKAMGLVLTEKGWQPHPIELDRSQLAGFMVDWPKKDGFDVLIKTLIDANPNLTESEDNISLMAVWVGNRLPYNLYNEEEVTH